MSNIVSKPLKFDYELKKKIEFICDFCNIKPKINELYKYDKYCKEILKRDEDIQNNLNNFDKDIQKEKDNPRSL